MTSKWKAGHNKRFDEMDRIAITAMMGSLQEPQHMKLPLKEIKPLQDIPTSFDPRQKWPNCQSLNDIRDQSNCGSCWAFGAVQAMSDRICIASNGKFQTRISSQDLLTCCGLSCGNGCNGGYPSSAWNYYKRTGLVTGYLYEDTKWCSSYYFAPCSHHVNSSYPNCTGQLPTPKCKRECSAQSSLKYQSDKHHADSVYSISSRQTQIQTQLMTHGPVEVSFTVYQDFLTYKSGVYHHVTGRVLGGHAVKMIGWGEQDGEKYWLIVNSWNQGWGDKGMFKIRRGHNQCGIQGSVVGGTPNLSN